MKKIGFICLGLLMFSTLLYGGGEFESSKNRRQPSESTQSGGNTQNAEGTDPERRGSDDSLQGTSGGSSSGETATATAAETGDISPGTNQGRSAGETPDLRLAILPFTGTTPVNGENLALLLSNDRDIREVFTVIVPRVSNLNSLVGGQLWYYLGLTDTDTIAAIGRQLNADFVVAGHIKKLGDRNLVLMTIVKVATFQQIGGGYREFYEIKDIRWLLPDMTKKMIEVIRLDTTQMPTLAVAPFSIPKSWVSLQDEEVLVQLLTIEIANSGKYMVLPRTQTIEIALSMVDTLKRELPDLDSIKAIGKAINAQCVLTGRVMGLGENSNLLVAQILNIEDTTLRAGGEIEYRTITDGFQLIPDLAFQLTGVPSIMPRISIPERTGGAVEYRAIADQLIGVSSIAIPENMVWIPGGTFQMGNTKGDVDELPVHTVQVSSFFLGKTPVTQKDYEAVMGKNPSATRGPQLPVENVTWYDAVEYCNKLSVREGLIPAYRGSNDNITCNFTANGYRLPTEAEWEYAARGGNRDTLTFDYAGGNSIDILGWYKGNSDGKSHEVGRKQANSLGLYDMAGNVWEWCWDWYWSYQGGKQQDPSGPSTGKERITRGGSWNSNPQELRSTYRSRGEPGKGYGDLGFRVLRPIF